MPTVAPITTTRPAGRAVQRSPFAKAVQASDLPASLKLLLLVLAWNGPADGSDRWQSNRQLAQACSLSERRIRQMTSAALSLGWLLADPRPGRTNLWQLAMPAHLKLVATAPSTPATHYRGGEATHDQGGGNPLPGGEATHCLPVVVVRGPRENAGGSVPQVPKSHPGWPSWCGHCNPDTRHIERGNSSARCPDCSPLLRTASGRLKTH